MEHALQRLSPELRGFLRPSEVFVADLPGVEVVVDGVDPRASLLLDSVRPDDDQPPTARLFVYQRNVERLAGSLDGLEPEIFESLEREIRGLFLSQTSQSEPASPKSDD